MNRHWGKKVIHIPHLVKSYPQFDKNNKKLHYNKNQGMFQGYSFDKYNPQ